MRYCIVVESRQLVDSVKSLKCSQLSLAYNINGLDVRFSDKCGIQPTLTSSLILTLSP